MGRYYNGDINGKFAFGVQSSGAADQFGCAGQSPNYLEYYFEETDIPAIKEGLKNIEKYFKKDQIDALHAYFDLYKTEDEAPMTVKAYMAKGEITPFSEVQEEPYYDYRLGQQILDCVKEHGECNFTAEL